VPIDGEVLLVGAATATSTRSQTALQKTAPRKSATVAPSAALDKDVGAESGGAGISIERLAQSNTQ